MNEPKPLKRTSRVGDGVIVAIAGLSILAIMAPAVLSLKHSSESDGTSSVAVEENNASFTPTRSFYEAACTIAGFGNYRAGIAFIKDEQGGHKYTAECGMGEGYALKDSLNREEGTIVDVKLDEVLDCQYTPNDYTCRVRFNF